ncbi:unnamed protein product [Rotaria sp. Silwood2]|nr:unnamed protein product [Rotaria sp. Silwood2]CAF3002191.1 unnamed protein product [Rotaria sp. Silwood2]CAF3214211.1 unnamed protein product [Rotaria sp. Silwood2]CAF3365932.1 unnamed protein product [Rotaria sp. Silwood2]CAF4308799.1 unnamed protein product [Rotaria sp. Silwood2]
MKVNSTKKTKHIVFISSPTFLCIEINVHHLTYRTLLVADNQFLVETLKAFSFNSQTCENFFSFSVQQYLHQQERISILHSIKTETNSLFTNTKFKFPNHHKTQRNHQQSTTPPEKVTKQQIEEQVNCAFQDAFHLLAPLGAGQILKKSKIINMKQQSTIEEDEQNEMDLYDYDSEDEDDNGINLLGHTTNSRLMTTKGLCDTINPDLKDSYFLVIIDGKKQISS